jgi:hypothetical protein
MKVAKEVEHGHDGLVGGVETIAERHEPVLLLALHQPA